MTSKGSPVHAPCIPFFLLLKRLSLLLSLSVCIDTLSHAGVVQPYHKDSLIPSTSTDSYAILKEAEFIGHNGRVWTLQASLGKLVTGSRDGSMRVWNYGQRRPNDAIENIRDMKQDYWGNYVLGKPHQR